MGKDVSWRDYVDALMAERDLRYQQRFEAQSQAIASALLAAEKAVTKADAATEKRFDGVNEFRRTLSDQAATFVTKTEFNALKERLDRTEGRSTGISAVWGVTIGAVGIIAAIVAIFVALR